VTDMASMASIAAHYSRFWIIPKSRQTTTARNAPCVPPPMTYAISRTFEEEQVWLEEQRV
jgi:hypothetical protein